MSDVSREVTLGEQSYLVSPQRIGYLRSKLGVFFNQLSTGGLDFSDGDVINTLGEKVHDVLKVFIPDLMPAWEFHGYATEEDWREGRYDDRYDKSPSPPQVRAAFTAVMEVNELDLLKHLGKIVDLELLRTEISERVSEAMLTASQQAQSEMSSALPTADTPSMTSGTSGPTSDAPTQVIPSSQAEAA